MTDPNEFNLPEFDTESLIIAQDLDLPDPFDIAVAVEAQENSDFIPMDDIDISKLGEE